MIYIAQEYKGFFEGFSKMDDFLDFDVQLVRDFKNRKTGRFEIDGNGFYIKKHFECGLSAIVDELVHFRRPHIGACHEKGAIDKLEELNISTMKVVAYGQDGEKLSRQRSFLITEELTRTKSLEEICLQWPSNPPDPGFKIDLINRIASVAKKMHENGINHRDFYICHFLLDTADKIYLIDLHRAQQRPNVPMRWRVKDIGGLFFSAIDIGLTKSDLFRFVKQYTGKPLKETLTNDRLFWKKVKRRAERMYRKEFGRSPDLNIKGSDVMKNVTANSLRGK